MKCLNSFLVVVTAMLAMSTGCKSGDEDKRPVLVVSIEPQRHMLEQLAGDNFRIVTMMPSGNNPETYEPSPAKRMALEDAEAYFTTGNLIFEDNLLLATKDTSLFVDTSGGLELIYGTHSHSGDHSAFLPGNLEEEDKHHLADPHIWSSVKNARHIAQVMTSALLRIDPDNSEEYRSRLDRYDAHLDSLDDVFNQKLANINNRQFLVWHPSLSYFARDYGLEQVAVGSEMKESSAESIGNLLEMAKAKQINTFIYQRELDSRHVDLITASLDAKIVPFNGLDYNWENELSKIVDGLSKQ